MLWTHEEVERLKSWQSSMWAHPLTCGACRDDGCGCDDRLDVTPSGLTHHCGYTQTWVPEICLELDASALDRGQFFPYGADS